MALWRFIERGTDHLRALATPLHVRHFLRTFINEQDEKIRLGIVLENGVRQLLHQHRFTGARRRDDKSASAFSNRANKVNNASGELILSCLEDETLVGEQRREIVEVRLVLRLLRILCIDRFHLEQREETLLLLRRTNLASDQIAGLKIEATNLRWGDVNILRAGQVIEALRTKEPESFRKNFKDAFRKQDATALRVLLQNVEDDLMLAHGAEILDGHVFGHLIQLRHRHRLQLRDVDGKRGLGGRSNRRRSFFLFLRFRRHFDRMSRQLNV